MTANLEIEASEHGQKDFILHGRAFAHLGELWTKTYRVVQHGLFLEYEETDDECEATEE